MNNPSRKSAASRMLNRYFQPGDGVEIHGSMVHFDEAVITDVLKPAPAGSSVIIVGGLPIKVEYEKLTKLKAKLKRGFTKGARLTGKAEISDASDLYENPRGIILPWNPWFKLTNYSTTRIIPEVEGYTEIALYCIPAFRFYCEIEHQEDNEINPGY